MMRLFLREPPKKVIQDGMVAILYSDGGKVGWYTEHGIYNLIFDGNIVEMISKPYNPDIVLNYCQRTYGMDVNYKAIPYLQISWVPEGTMIYFQCDEFGNETILSLDHVKNHSIQV